MKQICLILFSLSGQLAIAEDWYFGGGIGIFDVDRQQANTIEPATHFSSSTANLFLGYDFNKYLGVELQFDVIQTGFETDLDGFRSEFGGYAVSPALIVRYPLGESGGFDVFVRAGATYLDYTMANLDLGRKVDDTKIQGMFGAGFRWEYLFVEYVNFGRLHSMEMEQLRAGLRFSF